MEMFSLGTPAWSKRSMMLLSTPHVMGLITPSGGGGVNAELIFSTCVTNVGSFGIQLPMTNAPAGLGDADHLLGGIERLRSKHRAKDGNKQIKRTVGDASQIAGVSFLRLQSSEARLRGAPVPGLHQIPGDVDPNHFST